MSAATRELGIERTETRRAVKIAGIAPAAKDAARAAGLENNQTALLKVAAAEEGHQVAVVHDLAAARQASRAQPATPDPEGTFRASLDTEAVSEYAQVMRDGAQFPALVVFHDGEAHWLAEGFHRFAAAREAELATIACEVRAGSLRDAILHSAGANASHGLRRSNADKRRAVLLLLEDEEWSSWSNGEIARRCVVSDKTVAAIRSGLTPEIRSEPRTYQDRHGNVTQMRTSGIGRKPAETPADPPPPAEAPASVEPPADPTNVVSLASRLSASCSISRGHQYKSDRAQIARKPLI